MASKVDSFDCNFIEQPPAYLQSECPICLLVLRDPYQVTCCGKSICKACIQEIKAKKQPCPTCNKENFEHFPNLGLKQPLYGFKVYCCNKAKGCDWQGELGQLDQHLNLNPDKDKKFIGCAFAEIECLYCIYSTLFERCILETHQLSECLGRPFICSMCGDYKSTYDDVTNCHAPVCEYRPVECPNSCGDDNLQHQHLEEHLSSQCPLSLVECEFSHAGCDVEVCRKDLPSHLSDSMVTHMSLLARENRDMKLQLKKQVAKERKILLEVLNSIPPLDFRVLIDSNVQSHIFYTRRGYKLKLDVLYQTKSSIYYSFSTLESEFKVQSPCSLSITALLVDQAKNKNHLELKYDVDYPAKGFSTESVKGIQCQSAHQKNGCLLIRITNILHN